jgi:hypothetical protein
LGCELGIEMLMQPRNSIKVSEQQRGEAGFRAWYLKPAEEHQGFRTTTG